MQPQAELDPDLADHLARERAFDAVFAWPPLESATEARPRFVLQPWSINREARLDSLKADTSSDLETALLALWLLAHNEREIILHRIQSLGRQHLEIAEWCAANVLPSEKNALCALVDDIFRGADENKTLPAQEGGAGSGNA